MKNMGIKIGLSMKNASAALKKVLLKKREGVDGILVTVGLCIIALVLCVVMKDELTIFIKDIVSTMTTEAKGILQS